MSRLLKASGFLGLSVQMLWGMVNTFLITPGGPPLPPWVVGAHAHFGVLGILAVVLGFAVERYDLPSTQRRVVTGGYVAGQWLLPANILVAIGAGMPMLSVLEYLWGLLLFASMAVMTWHVWTAEPGAGGGRGVAAPADD
jgi:hypothetical protein